MKLSNLASLGTNLKFSRLQHFPEDNLQTFALRLGVSRATLQKMEKGDLSVSMEKYYRAGQILDLQAPFHELLRMEKGLFDD